MIVILFGAPGTGKGTLAKRLEAEGIGKHVSTGDLFRLEMAKGTEIGKKVRETTTAGKLVNDEDTLALLARELNGDVVLDGYPRTLKQVSDLDALVSARGNEIKLVVNLYADPEEILDRVVNRLTCSKCHAIYNRKYAPPKAEGMCDKCGGAIIHRGDDNEETFKTRLEEYKRKTQPILESYKKRGIVIGLYSSDEKIVEKIKSRLR